MRCLTLAAALQGAGWRCAFACNPEAAQTVKALGEAGLPVAPAEGLAAAWPDGCDLLVVDHYGLDAGWEAAQRPWARRVLAIDDLADRPHDCDLLLDGNLGRQAVDYAGRVPAGCTLLVGARYALLRGQFAAARPEALRRRARSTLRRVVVGLGSADPDDVTTRALEGLERSGLAVEVDVVLSAAAPHLGSVRERSARSALPVAVQVDVADVAGLFARADLAIGAAGTTAWERCAVGLPSLIVVLAENQRGVCDALVKAGAARSLGWHAALTPTAVATGVATLSDEERWAMSGAAAQVVDGSGARRVLEALG